MENKINLVEILRHCPQGMELDSPAYNNLYFDTIIDSLSYYPIKCYTTNNGMLTSVFFSKYGGIGNEESAKCVIFPKDKTTWDGFVPSCEFKDGDILYIDCNDNEDTHKEYQFIFILKEISNSQIYCYCYIDEANKYKNFNITWLSNKIYPLRFATKEEKQKLFKAIKENGYKWNSDTKTLEKLIKPKFKVGDKITDGNISITIDYMDNECYYDMGRNNVTRLFINYQDDWELVPNKFDISTLKPFESRVLVRDNDNDEWRGHFFSHYDNNKNRPYICIGDEGLNDFNQCIPYEGNEHLLGKTDDCDKYYKVW